MEAGDTSVIHRQSKRMGGCIQDASATLTPAFGRDASSCSATAPPDSQWPRDSYQPMRVGALSPPVRSPLEDPKFRGSPASPTSPPNCEDSSQDVTEKVRDKGLSPKSLRCCGSSKFSANDDWPFECDSPVRTQWLFMWLGVLNCGWRFFQPKGVLLNHCQPPSSASRHGTVRAAYILPSLE